MAELYLNVLKNLDKYQIKMHIFNDQVPLIILDYNYLPVP